MYFRIFLLFFVVLFHRSNAVSQKDTVFYSTSELFTLYEERGVKLIDPITKLGFSGWICDTLNTKNIALYKVHNGYREGIYLDYKKIDQKYRLSSFHVFQSSFDYPTITVFCNMSEKKELPITKIIYDDYFRSSIDSLRSRSIEFSGKDSAFWITELYYFPNKKSDKRNGKYQSKKFVTTDDKDINCFKAACKIFGYFICEFERLEEVPYPSHYLGYGCGLMYIPVFNE